MGINLLLSFRNRSFGKASGILISLMDRSVEAGIGVFKTDMQPGKLCFHPVSQDVQHSFITGAA